MVWQWILDSIPLWVYVTVGTIATLAAFYFASPILIPLWTWTPRWIKLTLGFIGSLFAALIYGRYHGAKNERELEAKRNAEALKKRTEVDNEVDTLPEKDVTKQLDPWMRD